MQALRFLTVSLAAAMLFAAAPSLAQDRQQAVKAGFLPKFARYVDYPPASRPGAGQPFYLCVIGRDPFGALLDEAAADEVIDGHSVAVRRFPNLDSDAIAGCHIAFVAGQTDAATGAFVEGLKQRPVLTVTDADLGEARGMIHFIIMGSQVRFIINQREATAEGLTISSQLLALAAEVTP